MNNLGEIDYNISKIEAKINTYLSFNAINKDKEKDTFLSCLDKNIIYNPKYRYRIRILKGFENQLKDLLHKLNSNDKLESLFRCKIEYILLKLELLKADDDSFTDTSIKLYGLPSSQVLAKAKNILENDTSFKFSKENIKPKIMAQVLRDELKNYNINWRIIEVRNIIPKISISAYNNKILINSNINYTEGEIQRLRVHEMVHVLRAVNGKLQGWDIFKNGLGYYDETEEGLAVYAADISGKLNLDPDRLKVYAGRVLAINIGLENSFYDTFSKLRAYFSLDLAYRLTERAKRGMKDTSRKGVFTKDFYYISGWGKVKEFIENKGNLDTLYIGKIGLEDVKIAESLLSENVLVKPRYIINTHG